MSGCRRLWALVDGLPGDAAVWREGRRWTTEHELLARSIEQADMWSRLLLIAFGAKPDKLPKPVPIEHPGRLKAGAPTGAARAAAPAAPRRVVSDPTVIAGWFSKHMH